MIRRENPKKIKKSDKNGVEKFLSFARFLITRKQEIIKGYLN